MPDHCDLLCLNLPIAEALRERAKAQEGLADAARLHSALGDELRLAMLTSLAEGELCGCDLAWIHEKSQSLISHHMKTLLAAGLTESRRDGKIVFFSLTDTGARFAPRMTVGAST
jgi:DNA-binding transcriptional ArsR family regulator